LFVAAATVLCGVAGRSSRAQVASAEATPPAEAKPILFETASIKPSREDEPFDQRVLPDGFMVRHNSIARLIWFAYCPSGLIWAPGTYLGNAPDWVWEDKVDVLAKVSAEDAPEWEREKTSTWDGPPLKHALRELLADRYKLQAHTIPVEADGFALVVKKSGRKTKLVPAGQGQPQDSGKTDSPSIVVLPGGVVQFHNETLAELAVWLSPLSSSPIEDRTGLTGRYDFTVRDMQPVHPADEDREYYRQPTHRWELEPLGLVLVRAKVHTIALIVDHIERPSPN
jgi:uncharacterized protein (TIGR03435 family)